VIGQQNRARRRAETVDVLLQPRRERPRERETRLEVGHVERGRAADDGLVREERAREENLLRGLRAEQASQHGRVRVHDPARAPESERDDVHERLDRRLAGPGRGLGARRAEERPHVPLVVVEDRFDERREPEADELRRRDPVEPRPLDGCVSDDFEHLRWFELPAACLGGAGSPPARVGRDAFS